MNETMNQKLNRLAKESEYELVKLGLGDKLKHNIHYTINYRAKQRFGQCRGKQDINISSWLLEIGTDKDIKNTIIHEILHTFEDTEGHGARWQYYARYINNNTDYDIKTTNSINKIYQKANVERPLGKYSIKCLGCGNVWYKSRMQSDTLWGYRHGYRYHKQCGCNQFKVIDTRTDEVLVNGVEV